MGTLQNRAKENKMILSTDIGSLPFEGSMENFDVSLKELQRKQAYQSAEEFQQKIVETFLDKMNAGIDVPNFPQFRDMNQMFLSLIEGSEKTENGYVETPALHVKPGEGRIAEMEILRRNAGKIAEKTGNLFKIRFCITGPYTMSRLFAYKNPQTLTRLGDILAEIIEQNIFRDKNCVVTMVSVDEPIFGLVDDPLLDWGSDGREALLKAWETMFHTAAAKNVETCIHLHTSSDELFWEAKTLEIIDFPVNDSIYRAKTTKRKLEAKDKFLKASICITDFDALIMKKLETHQHRSISPQEIGEVWKQIVNGNLDPKTFIEDIRTMKKRLHNIVKLFGVERVPYAGPECGLRGFPTYECAIECLKRVATSVIEYET